ncbi:cytochrome P450 [Streptomyces uncialis]|uniref:cytochrome P450 n=1 Tax=Streptomyces uncialis TaxID=1048205 RepID=UPI000AD9CC6A|nr:cytochrome P450 [Streptomyces uncialis]MCX4659604.1 cytochrome P450 [Streptomyces uncialis]WST67701.1 cytochrome P450 [Streptomyces uncialis]WTE13671.1 cytochrome P450 [Streptomyces uncialis]
MDAHSGSTPQTPPPGCPMHQGRTPLYGEEFAADPYGTYDRMRAQGPAVPVELAPGVDATLVIQHEAALRVLQNPALFVRDSRRWRALNEGRVPLDSPVLPMMYYRPNCLFSDGAEHLRLRKAATDSLNQLNMNRLTRDVERVADYLIDQFSERGGADLLRDYAKILPMLLFNQLFGCPADIGDRMTRGIAGIFDGGQDAIRANEELTSALLELVALKRRSPGEDVTTWMIQHHAGLTDEELKDQLVTMMAAGIEPQSSLICSAVLLLLNGSGTGHGRGTGLLVEDALDNVLWNNSPLANYATHFPVQDIMLGDITLRANDPVVISFAAANTDPSLTDARLTLSKGAHLAFGAGPHTCPAKSPARVIAIAAIERILNALPDLALAVPEEKLEWRPGPFHRALVSMPVHFSPVPARRVPPRPAAPARAADGMMPGPQGARTEPRKQKGWWSSFLDVFRM